MKTIIALIAVIIMLASSATIFAQAAGGEYNVQSGQLQLHQYMMRLFDGTENISPDPAGTFRVRADKDIGHLGSADRHRDPTARDYNEYNPLITSPESVLGAFSYNLYAGGQKISGDWDKGEGAEMVITKDGLVLFAQTFTLNSDERNFISRALSQGQKPYVEFTVHLVSVTKPHNKLWAWFDLNDAATVRGELNDVLYRLYFDSSGQLIAKR